MLAPFQLFDLHHLDQLLPLPRPDRQYQVTVDLPRALRPGWIEGFACECRLTRELFIVRQIVMVDHGLTLLVDRYPTLLVQYRPSQYALLPSLHRAVTNNLLLPILRRVRLVPVLYRQSNM